MHTKRFKRDWLSGLVVGGFVLAMTPGCELLVDFDRSLIPNDSGLEEDVATPDGTLAEGGPLEDATADADATTSPDADAAPAVDAAGDGGAIEAGSEDAADSATSDVDAAAATTSDASDDGGDAADGS
jgi:hypothetical protein